MLLFLNMSEFGCGWLENSHGLVGLGAGLAGEFQHVFISLVFASDF
jgi:hypothetical protein